MEDSPFGSTHSGCWIRRSSWICCRRPAVVDERSCLKRTKWPSEGLPKGGTQVLAVCVTPGQLDDCVALASQQDSEQSALRERKGRG